MSMTSEYADGISYLVGNLKSLNDLAKQARADHIIHTGDFGFYDDTSLDRIADKYVFSCCQTGRLLIIV